MRLMPVLLAALIALPAAAKAETIDLSGGPPTAEELIRALTPPDTRPVGTESGVVGGGGERRTGGSAMGRTTTVERRVRLDIPFANNSAELDPAAMRALNALVQALTSRGLATTLVMIEGHANRTGSAEHNRTLTRARSETVARYLYAHGVAAGRLRTAGYGYDRPIPGIDPRDGRNRRVEIVALP